MPPQDEEGEKVIEIRSFGGYGGEGVRQSQALARRAGEVGRMQKLGISGRLQGWHCLFPAHRAECAGCVLCSTTRSSHTSWSYGLDMPLLALSSAGL